MEEENGVKQRLKAFVKYLNISERRFCILIGKRPAYIASIKRSISPNALRDISNKYPELNTTWLIQGKGEMLNAVEEKKPVADPTETLAKLLEASTNEKARLLSIIESQQETISTLTESLKKEVAQKEEAVSSADVG
jgi:hypothetical protein